MALQIIKIRNFALTLLKNFKNGSKGSQTIGSDVYYLVGPFWLIFVHGDSCTDLLIIQG